jgi:hypothetical protein
MAGASGIGARDIGVGSLSDGFGEHAAGIAGRDSELVHAVWQALELAWLQPDNQPAPLGEGLTCRIRCCGFSSIAVHGRIGHGAWGPRRLFTIWQR